MKQGDRVGDFLRRLTPVKRNSLLNELERLEVCGDEIPGAAPIVEKLRAEFRKDAQPPNRAATPSHYFFAPLEPLLVDGAPEHANSGLIPRGSLSAIWEWISRDLLPTMARDYVTAMTPLIAANNQREARRVATTFQTKVVKYLESTLGSPDGVEQTREKLAAYTASRTAYDDLTKMICVLHARDALAKFNEALPAKIDKFDDARLAKVSKLLGTFAKNHAEAPAKNATDIAAVPYALAVSMVLDRVDDKRALLRVALKNNRIVVAKNILAEIYGIERAVRARIDLLDQSEWGARLNNLMNAIAALIESEVTRFPDEVGHILGGSRSLRGHQSLAGRLTDLAWKGRDVMSGGAALCKKLIGQS
jgi:hypothetical protein